MANWCHHFGSLLIFAHFDLIFLLCSICCCHCSNRICSLNAQFKRILELLEEKKYFKPVLIHTCCNNFVVISAFMLASKEVI